MSPISKDVACMANIHSVQLRHLKKHPLPFYSLYAYSQAPQTHIINDGMQCTANTICLNA